ncbi:MULTISPECIES: hypothetical protein [unclassified Streptomyces]|uniref:hypothetical protein n=1 Tax=unclassified Streptomyces TaxID=2593676 RepID=UPI00380FC022
MSTVIALGIAVPGERLPAVSWRGLGVPALGLTVLAAPARPGRRSPAAMTEIST